MHMTDFPANPIDKPGYRLEFNETFSGPDIDPARWIPYYLPQWSSRALSAPRYRWDEDGFALTIEADQPPWCPEFDGAVRCSSLQTGVYAGPLGSAIGQHRFNPACVVREEQPTQRTYTPQYGYFEARIRAVRAPNTVVALWMIGFEETPEQSGEIALFEVFGDAISDAGSEVRYGIKPWGDPALTHEFYRERLAFDATRFHLYAIEWTPTRIDVYIDNHLRRTIGQSPAYPLQFMLNIYDLPGTPPTPPSSYPKRFIIDYVRGYQPIDGY